MAELLGKVKMSLRISHNKLDDDISTTISASKAEMERAGIDESKILDSDPLIVDAIKVYCKYSFASNDKLREGYFKSWQYQLDCLRKSSAYSKVVE